MRFERIRFADEVSIPGAGSERQDQTMFPEDLRAVQLSWRLDRMAGIAKHDVPVRFVGIGPADNAVIDRPDLFEVEDQVQLLGLQAQVFDKDGVVRL